MLEKIRELLDDGYIIHRVAMLDRFLVVEMYSDELTELLVFSKEQSRHAVAFLQEHFPDIQIERNGQQN